MKQIPNLFGIVILFLALIVSEVNSEVSKEVSNISNYDESRLLLLGFGDFYTGDQYANFLVFFKEYENQLIPVNSEPKYNHSVIYILMKVILLLKLRLNIRQILIIHKYKIQLLNVNSKEKQIIIFISVICASIITSLMK